MRNDALGVLGRRTIHHSWAIDLILVSKLCPVNNFTYCRNIVLLFGQDWLAVQLRGLGRQHPNASRPTDIFSFVLKGLYHLQFSKPSSFQWITNHVCTVKGELINRMRLVRAPIHHCIKFL